MRFQIENAWLRVGPYGISFELIKSMYLTGFSDMLNVRNKADIKTMNVTSNGGRMS